MPCERHPSFKERFRNLQVDETCTCNNFLGHSKCGRCEVLCYTLNFAPEKLVVCANEKLPDETKLIDISDYLEKFKNQPFFLLFQLLKDKL